MKIFRKLFLSSVLVLILFILSSFLIMHFYSAEVSGYVIREINKTSSVAIQVEQVEDISLFKKFPFASIALSDILIMEKTKKAEPDTLLYLKKIYLQFNILDILTEDYRIKRISLADGFANLKIDSKGNENYSGIFQGNSTENSEKSAFLLKLSRMSVSNFMIHFHNAIKKQDYNILCNEVILKGDFSDDEFLMKIDGDFFTNRVKMEESDFLQNRSVKLISEMHVNKSKGSYQFKKGEITIDQAIAFQITGNIINSEKNTVTGLQLKAKDLDISSALELLPPSVSSYLSDYESAGKITFNCKIEGAVGKEQNPGINAEFTVQDGFFKQKSTSFSFNSINLEGTYSNGSKHNSSATMIRITNCSAGFCMDGDTEAGKNINAAFTLTDLNNPYIKLDGAGRLDMNKLARFFTIDTLQSISGTADFKIKYAGVLKSGKDYSVSDFKNSKSSGTVKFDNINFQLKQSPVAYTNLNGTLVMQNNDIVIQGMKGNISSSDFELDGLFRNALAYLFVPGEKLTIEAVLSSKNLDLNELLTESESGADTTYLFALPDYINFNLNADIEQLQFRKFIARDVSGIVTVNDKRLSSENISFKTLDGEVNSSLEIDASSSGKILIQSKAAVSTIDIQKLFTVFENFGQEVITDRHLRGIATASILFSMQMDSALNIDENKINTLADLSIERGELISFEAMDDISAYIKNHIFLKRLVKADELENKLKHIRFSLLKNQIQLINRKIIIPVMDIRSSALNIETEGIHSFDNELDYKLNFFLSELLIKKEEISQDEFGEIEDDGTGRKKIFMTIKGTIDEPIISYDKKKVKTNVIMEAQQEKNIVKGILKEEFGWFKKDSSAIIKDHKKKADFVIEWEENKKPAPDRLDEKPGQVKDKKEVKQQNVTKFLDNLNKEKEKETEDFELEKGEDF